MVKFPRSPNNKSPLEYLTGIRKKRKRGRKTLDAIEGEGITREEEWRGKPRPSSCPQGGLRILWWRIKIKSIQLGQIFAELHAWFLSVWALHTGRRSHVHQVLRSYMSPSLHNWSIRMSGKKEKDVMIIQVGTGSCRQRAPFITNFSELLK